MAGLFSRENVTRQRPCVICGKPDWCFIGNFGEDGTLHYCARIQQQTIRGSDGLEYYNKATKKHPSGISDNGYFIYESVLQKEANDAAFIERTRLGNPNYKGYSKKPSVAPQAAQTVQKSRIAVDNISPLSNEQLDIMYRYLLDLLVLEPHHESYLREEWNAGYDKTLADKILKAFPIKSLPMNDQARFQGRYKLKSNTRKEIVAKMVERFGSLRGLPGFFTYESTWRMVNLSGIVYPEYDSDGYIYRVRIMDEHPRIAEYAKTKDGDYLYEDDRKGGQSKKICAEYSFNQKTGEWCRKDLGAGEEEIVFSIPKGIRKVELNKKGYPVIDGKVEGKYKNFSSYSEGIRETDNKVLVYNRYQEGCQSGSNISLYTKEGDNPQFVYITEGEKKAIVINSILHCPVISLPGVGTYSKIFAAEYKKEYSLFDMLVARGATHFIVVYDSDKETNLAVLNAERGVVSMCREHSVTTLIGYWDPRYGKGADDILIAGKEFTCISEG